MKGKKTGQERPDYVGKCRVCETPLLEGEGVVVGTKLGNTEAKRKTYECAECWELHSNEPPRKIKRVG